MAENARLVLTEPRASRRRVESPATVARDDGAHEAVIHDLSATGFLATIDATLEIGDEVVMEAPGLPRAIAVVVRTDGDRYGCRFIGPLEQAQVEQAGTMGNVRHVSFGLRDVTHPGTVQTDDAAADRAADADQPGLSILTRLTIIAGVSGALWAGIIAAGLWALA